MGQPDLKLLSAFPQLNPNPVIGVDSARRVTFLNDGATQALESLGKDASPDVFLPKDMDQILAALKRRERATFRREVTVGDHVFEESIQVSPEHDVAGIFATDITERKQAETALLTQRNRARDYFDIAGVILVAMDTAGVVTLINRRGCEVLGWAEREVVGSDWFETFLPKRTRAEMRNVFRHLLAGEPIGPEHSETLVLSRSGEERMIAWHDRLLRDETGRVTGILSSGEDVTGHRRAEDALRASEERYSSIYNGVADGIIYIGKNGIVLDANEPLIRMTGRPREEMVGRHVAHLARKFMSLADVPQMLKSIAKLSAGHAPASYEVRLNDRWLEFGSPNPTGDGGFTAVVHDITERKRAGEALVQSEEKYRRLIENSHDIIYTLTTDGVFTFVSPAWTALLGHPANQVCGQPFQQFVHPDDLPACLEFLRKAIATGQRQEGVEYRVRHTDGTWYWHTTSAVPLRDNAGTVVGFEGTARDITRRKRAETAIAESELKYRRVFEASNDAIMLLDSERFFDCNEATLRVFGCSTRDEFLGKHPAEVSPPTQLDGRQSRAAADENMAATFRDGRNYFEWLHRRADGSVFPADVLLTPLDYQGRTVLQATVRDISARKQADHALSESEERYRRLVADMGEGIGVGDADERFTFANRAAEELFGVTDGGLVGRSLLEFLDTGQADFVHRQTARRRAGGTSSYELEITRSDGTRRTTLITSSPQYDADGNYTGAFGIFHDITARRQAEQQAQAERDQLRRILDAMPDGAYVVGQDHELQYVNPSLLASSGPVNGRKCHLYFHGRAEPCPDCTNQEAFAGVATRREYTTKQGVTFDIQDVPVTGSDRRPARLVLMRNITARKRAEQALRESEAKFKHLFEESPSGIALVDTDGIVQETNPRLLKLLGIRREDMVGRSFRQLLPAFGLDRKKQDADFERRLAGEPAARELTFRGQDGRQMTLEVQSSVIVSPGEPAGIMFLLTDITERKQSEERDRRHLEDTALLRDTALGFIQLAPDADIYQYVADRLSQLVGEAYVVINSYHEAMDQFTVRAISGIGARLETVLKVMGRNPVGTVFTLSAEHRPEYASMRLLKFEDGIRGLSYGRLPSVLAQTIEKTFDIGGVYAMGFYWQGRILGTMNLVMRRGAEVRDPAAVEAFINQAAIALQRKLDAVELGRYRDHLEELVYNRTNELEVANRELEAFSYSVSHDLRAPLRAIDGFTLALLDDCGPQLNAQARGHLNRVSAAARRMAELIDDLLSLAHIARMPLERQPVDLSELARMITGELREAEPARQVELVIQDGMTAQADPDLAGMVLRNLMDNAWRFTSKRRAARIEIGEARVDGERVWFVRDNGAGFDMAYVSNLFAPFQRLHTTADFAGTGIGLAIVQRVVWRHGGRVWIEAEIDKGATCRFTLEPASKEA